MRVNDAFHNGEPQTGPDDLSGIRRFDPVKLVKYPRDVFTPDADARIGDRNLHKAVIVIETDRHSSSVGGVFNSIGNKVVQDAFHAVLVGLNDGTAQGR